MIYSNETEFAGSWLLENGNVKDDNVSMRIKDLIVNYLSEIAMTDDGWQRLYQDPNDGRYWELSYPHSDWEGGGPPSLKNNIVFMVVIIYATKVHAYAIYSKSNLH